MLERHDLCKGYFWSLIYPVSEGIKEVITVSELSQKAVSNNGIAFQLLAGLLTESLEFPSLLSPAVSGQVILQVFICIYFCGNIYSMPSYPSPRSY